MPYNFLNNAYQTDIRIKVGQTFQFIVDGVRKVSQDYDIRKVKPGEYVNVYSLGKQGHHWRDKNSDAKVYVPSQFAQTQEVHPMILQNASRRQPFKPKVKRSRVDRFEDISFKKLNESIGGSYISQSDNGLSITTVHNYSARLPTADVSFDDEDAPPDHEEREVLASSLLLGHYYDRYKEERKAPIPKEKQFHFVSGARAIPKVEKDGEDAFFTTERALGVADGVGGWNQYGIDSSQFATQLMENCRKNVRSMISCGNNKIQTLDLVGVLERSYAEIKAIGSSTATLVGINGENFVGLNLGDSGFVYFRKMGGIYVSNAVSKEQQHNFNTPFQLSRSPTKEKIQSLSTQIPKEDMEHLDKILQNNEICEDQPKDADKYSFKLQDGDVVVLGTDGLFDNLFKDEIKKIVREYVQDEDNLSEKTASELANALATAAFKKSKMEEVKTPFQVKFKREFNASWVRGKEDDITVVVGLIRLE